MNLKTVISSESSHSTMTIKAMSEINFGTQESHKNQLDLSLDRSIRHSTRMDVLTKQILQFGITSSISIEIFMNYFLQINYVKMV